MNNINTNTSTLENLLKITLERKIEEVVPNFRKKTFMTSEEIERIIQTISVTTGIKSDRVLIGIMLLFLQGAASAGSPPTLSVELEDGKSLTKKDIIAACIMVAKHQYIRRIAESLAKEIGQFAEKNKLHGELAHRINNRFKAETGSNLSDIELSYCSSFSQSIPNLAEITSERLAKLLAEDYQKRFENKKKTNLEEKKAFKKKSAKPKRRK